MPRTRQIDFEESRVLGALMEKEQTTPDAYPLTINSLVAACNQKTSRDPVTDLSETEIVDALDRLRRDALAWRSEGARTERWEHLLDRRWGLDRRRKAIMTLLLLRGPQTSSELKTRGERMAGFATRDEVEALLAEMAAEMDPLVEELRRQPGQRETRWRHLMAVGDGSGPVAVAQPHAVPDLPQSATSSPAPSEVEDQGRRVAGDERLDQLEATVDQLGRSFRELRNEMKELRRRLGDTEE